MFNEFDTDGNGVITEKEFRAALKHYSFPFKLTKHEMKMLMSYFKRNGEAGVSFAEFAAFVCPDSDMDGVERKLRAVLSAQDALHTNVTRTFKSLDKMGVGTLPIGPFRQAMRDLGLPVTSNEASTLIDHFDPTGKGEILIPRERVRSTTWNLSSLCEVASHRVDEEKKKEE